MDRWPLPGRVWKFIWIVSCENRWCPFFQFSIIYIVNTFQKLIQSWKWCKSFFGIKLTLNRVLTSLSWLHVTRKSIINPKKLKIRKINKSGFQTIATLDTIYLINKYVDKKYLQAFIGIFNFYITFIPFKTGDFLLFKIKTFSSTTRTGLRANIFAFREVKRYTIAKGS